MEGAYSNISSLWSTWERIWTQAGTKVLSISLSTPIHLTLSSRSCMTRLSLTTLDRASWSLWSACIWTVNLFSLLWYPLLQLLFTRYRNSMISFLLTIILPIPLSPLRYSYLLSFSYLKILFWTFWGRRMEFKTSRTTRRISSWRIWSRCSALCLPTASIRTRKSSTSLPCLSLCCWMAQTI